MKLVNGHNSAKKLRWGKKIIYIYIYTRFQKRFLIETYIDRYILLFSCTCARVHFSLVIV